jgi:hypothetical protein
MNQQARSVENRRGSMAIALSNRRIDSDPPRLEGQCVRALTTGRHGRGDQHIEAG